MSIFLSTNNYQKLDKLDNLFSTQDFPALFKKSFPKYLFEKYIYFVDFFLVPHYNLYIR